MSDLYRRCGCRDENGKTLGQRCPQLKDAKHGTWAFTVSAGSDPGTGRRVQIRRMGFATKAEAQRERAKVVTAAAVGRYKSDRKLTLSDYLPQWLERRVSDGLRPSTRLMYARYIEQDIVPAIGRARLSDLRKSDVDQFVQQLRKDGRGATTIRRIHAVLSSALTAAEHLDLIDNNPALRIALPSPSKTRSRIWEPQQVRVFLDTAGGSRLGPVFELAVFTGLRRGELAGLKWADVDLTKRELIVRQARVQVGNSVHEGAVKTDSGQDRRVSLGSEAVGALIGWKVRQEAESDARGAAYQDEGHVFTYEDGRPLRPAHLSRVFTTLVARSGLPSIRFHDLRHEHASLLLAGGVDIAVVSKRLGHSTIAVTSDLYGHLLADANRAAADAAELMLPAKVAV